MVTPEFPPKWGGVGNGVYFQTNVFAQKKGYEIDIIIRKMNMKIPPIHPSITVHEVPWLKLPMFYTTSFGRQAVKKIVKLEKEKKYDIVHIHSNITLIDRKAYDTIEAPIVSTMHGTWKGERSQLRLRDITLSVESLNDLAVLYLSPFFDKYEDWAIELSNAVTIDSKSEWEAIMRRGVRNKYGRMVLIPEGVDVESFHPKKKDERIKEKYGVQGEDYMLLTVSRLAARKGVNLLLQSFKAVLDKVKRCHLVIVGSGPQYKFLKRLSKKLEIDKKVTFAGRTPLEDLEKLYATADLFVFHSKWEGQGLIIEEAMASGTPCVSSRVGGVPEMIEQGVDGYYVEVGDIEGMAGRIIELLEDDGKRKKMGEIGRKKMVREWSWQVISERYHKLYLDVIEKPLGTVGKG